MKEFRRQESEVSVRKATGNNNTTVIVSPRPGPPQTGAFGDDSHKKAPRSCSGLGSPESLGDEDVKPRVQRSGTRGRRPPTQ